MNKINEYINNNLEDTNFFEGELKVGYLKNDFLNYNINKKTFYGFKNFLEKNNQSTKINQKLYQYYDMMMISKDEHSHVCFKIHDSDMSYYTPFDRNYSLRFKNYNFNVIDNIYFPSLEKYHNYEEQDIDRFSITYKNSTINIDFININDKVYSIVFKFKVENSNLDNFKRNLNYILTKFYRKKVNLF